MQAPNLFVILFIYIAFVGCSNSAASLENGVLEESSKPTPSHLPSRGAILEAFLNYLFTIYPSSDTRSSLGWDYRAGDSQDYSQGTPKRLYYAPRAGKRSSPTYDDGESTPEVANPATEGTRWKRNAIDEHQEESEDFRTKREAPKTDTNNDEDSASNFWSWSKAAVRRSPFSPRLGKRGDEDIQEDSEYDDEFADEDVLNDDDNDDDSDEFDEELMTPDYSEDVITAPRLMIRSALVPRLGKKSMVTFSPRLGKRKAFIPRLGKKADFAFSPRLGKRGDFAFSPRLGKKAADFPFSPRPGKRENFAFSPRLGKKADFAFSPRLGKRGDFAFSPRLGKRADFAFSPRLGKRADFAFIPRLGKRGRTAFIPRLGKRDFSTPSSTPVEAWRSEDTGDFTHSLEQH